MKRERQVVMEFDTAEYAIAAAVAASNVRTVIERKLNETYGSRAEGMLHRHVTGTLGEMAFARWLDVYYRPVLMVHRYGGDVKGHEVRGVEFEHGKEETGKEQDHLLVRHDEPDDRRYVLVMVQLPRATLCGWIVGRDAKRREWFKVLTPGRPPVHVVPHKALRGMDEWHDREPGEEG